MKKLKFLCILFSVAISLCFGLTACTAADNSPIFDETFPWSHGSVPRIETATYEFSRYLSGVTIDEESIAGGEDKDKGYKLNSSGKVTYTIKEGTSVEFKDGVIKEIQNQDTPDFTLIKMELTVEYKTDLAHIPNASARNLHAGKTDTMISYSVIDRYTLNPLFTYKKTDIGAQTAEDNKSYTMTADYTGNFTGKKEATLSDVRGEFKLQIKDGKYSDSESVYFIIRAMRSVRTSDTTSRAFEIASPYDDLLNNAKRLSSKKAQQSTSTSLSKVALKESVYNLFAVEEDQKNEKFELNCYNTTLSLTETKSGPPINLYYSAAPTRADFELGVVYSSKKVLVMSSYKNHDKATNAIYLQEFKLINYSFK